MKTINEVKRTHDMTEGIIWKQLLLFALPLLGSSLVQQMYNTVDLIFVGNVLGKEASAAVGASSLIITCLVGFFTGLSVGTVIIIAQSFGHKAKTDLQRAVHTTIGLSFSCLSISLRGNGLKQGKVDIISMKHPLWDQQAFPSCGFQQIEVSDEARGFVAGWDQIS